MSNNQNFTNIPTLDGVRYVAVSQSNMQDEDQELNPKGNPKGNQGFASMDPEKQQEIAKKGGHVGGSATATKHVQDNDGDGKLDFYQEIGSQGNKQGGQAKSDDQEEEDLEEAPL